VKAIRSIALLIVSLFVLTACGQLTEDRTGLMFATADPRLTIGVRLLPPPPAPDVAPVVVPECLIKGNVSSSGERIFHVPGGVSYDRTQIDTARGEEWLCSEEEAVEKGYRKAAR
jgi:hypothetical protein